MKQAVYLSVLSKLQESTEILAVQYTSLNVIVAHLHFFNSLWYWCKVFARCYDYWWDISYSRGSSSLDTGSGSISQCRRRPNLLIDGQLFGLGTVLVSKLRGTKDSSPTAPLKQPISQYLKIKYP